MEPLAELRGSRLLGTLPIIPALCVGGDSGQPDAAERVPLVRELVHAPRAEATYWLLNAGIPVVLVGVPFGLPWMATAGGVALAATAIVFAINMLGVLRR